MQKLKLFILSLLTLVISFFAISPVALAAQNANCTKSFFGIPTWYRYLPLDEDCTVDSSKVDGGIAVLVTLAIIEILLFAAGFLAAGFIIYGSFKFIMSQGDPQKVVSARTTIANAVVGLIIAVIASRVVSFIASTLSAKATSGSTDGILGDANIPNVAASTSNLQDLLSIVFALAGAIALLVITIAGFRFVISQGDPQKVATARLTILYAVIGLVISVFSFTIVKFVLGQT